ncbi:MAG: hypothetical protein NTX03_00450, partial [Bacteroidetes bacterium]|nr:hypothetical protein [Bacteroidota bacterium]
PLFPLVWKALGLNSIGISIFNFLLFCFSVSLLLKVFLKKEQNLWVYISLFIASPFMVFFIIPYSESVFFFSVTLLFYGVMKNKYPYYFAGGILISMARSASFFIAIPILILEIIFLFSRTKISLAIKESALKILPFVIGFLVVLCIQYYYSNSWNAFLEAQAHWPKSTIITLNFVDWSFEGFGLACFAIFFAAIPAFLLFFNLIFSDKSPLNFPLNSKEEFTISPEKYITLISVFYLILIFIYTLLARGGSLNSFPRYSLATPFFYVIILYVSQNFSLKKQALYSLILLVLLVAFLAWVSYGGDKISFYYLGMYLSLFSMVLLLLLPQIKILALRISLIAVFVFLSIIWNSYLLNIFLSDGWIFT